MLHLKEVLIKRLRQNGITGKVSAAQVVDTAQGILLEVFSEDLVGRMVAAHVKNKTLTVRVESPAVGQELKFKEMEILKKLNKKMPHCEVERIRFSM